MNPVELYEQLPLAEQKLFDEVNFLATELRDHLLPEQFLLAIEAMTARLQALHPEIPCTNGCFACCERDALPLIGPSEWELIQSALADLSVDKRQQIKQQTEALTDSIAPEDQHNQQTRACPLLIEGRCSVYAMRPLACRLTGYSFSELGERPLPQLPAGMPVPYSCRPEQERILSDLQALRNPLHYMFLPQLEKLQSILWSLDANQETSPRLLVNYLHDYFASPGL